MTFNAKSVADELMKSISNKTERYFVHQRITEALLSAYQEGLRNSDDKWRSRKDDCVDGLRKGIAFWEKKALEAHSAGVSEGLEKAALELERDERLTLTYWPTRVRKLKEPRSE